MNKLPEIKPDTEEAIKNLMTAMSTAEAIAFGDNVDDMEILGAMVCAKEAIDFFAE